MHNADGFPVTNPIFVGDDLTCMKIQACAEVELDSEILQYQCGVGVQANSATVTVDQVGSAFIDASAESDIAIAEGDFPLTKQVTRITLQAGQACSLTCKNANNQGYIGQLSGISCDTNNHQPNQPPTGGVSYENMDGFLSGTLRIDSSGMCAKIVPCAVLQAPAGAEDMYDLEDCQPDNPGADPPLTCQVQCAPGYKHAKTQFACPLKNTDPQMMHQPQIAGATSGGSIGWPSCEAVAITEVQTIKGELAIGGYAEITDAITKQALLSPNAFLSRIPGSDSLTVAQRQDAIFALAQSDAEQAIIKAAKVAIMATVNVADATITVCLAWYSFGEKIFEVCELESRRLSETVGESSLSEVLSGNGPRRLVGSCGEPCVGKEPVAEYSVKTIAAMSASYMAQSALAASQSSPAETSRLFLEALESQNVIAPEDLAGVQQAAEIKVAAVGNVEVQQLVAVCGNGIREGPGEECDDGNTIASDGCTETCTIEMGYECLYRGNSDGSDLCREEYVPPAESDLTILIGFIAAASITLIAILAIYLKWKKETARALMQGKHKNKSGVDTVR